MEKNTPWLKIADAAPGLPQGNEPRTDNASQLQMLATFPIFQEYLLCGTP